ncbi:Guanine nucleotide-binding protein G(q) subunit alpha [Blattella germanica]|nr:Guanine nucleotide-binding protein G(q) subunit alpha [Blattella germanica]
MNSDIADKLLCCCQSQEARIAKRFSDDIDKKLLDEVKNQQTEFKLLLLGAGESGKSTFLKQMKIIHGEGYTEEERKTFVQAIYHNLCIAIQTLVKNMKRQCIGFGDSANIIRSKKFEDAVFTFKGEVSPEYINDCTILWADPGIRECYERRNNFYILESAIFLPKIDEVIDPSYTPTTQDILHARIPTSGIHEHSFCLDDVIFRIVDVGGQRRERRKWIHCFENVTSIVFLTAISEFDQELLEDDTVNRLEESMALFQVTISSQWFQRSSVMLFLNKIDLFQEKIQFHTENIKFVFDVVRDTILQINLEDYNLA